MKYKLTEAQLDAIYKVDALLSDADVTWAQAYIVSQLESARVQGKDGGGDPDDFVQAVIDDFDDSILGPVSDALSEVVE